MVKIIIFLIFLTSTPALAAHQYKEKEYQEAFCKEVGGVTEYVLDDGARVDCLTDEYAIEFDFGAKWAESVGQSLYYGLKTNKKSGIVLILESERDNRFFKRLSAVAGQHNLKVWTMMPVDIKFDKK